MIATDIDVFISYASKDAEHDVLQPYELANQREQFQLGEIEDAEADFAGDLTVRYARRAARIMEGTLERQGEAETAILHMVGLFDRPAEREALEAVLAEPAIPGLTDAFHGLSASQRKARWNVAVERLRKLKLLSVEDRHAPGALDAHPIVRAHFGELPQPHRFLRSRRQREGMHIA